VDGGGIPQRARGAARPHLLSPASRATCGGDATAVHACAGGKHTHFLSLHTFMHYHCPFPYPHTTTTTSTTCPPHTHCTFTHCATCLPATFPLGPGAGAWGRTFHCMPMTLLHPPPPPAWKICWLLCCPAWHLPLYPCRLPGRTSCVMGQVWTTSHQRPPAGAAPWAGWRAMGHACPSSHGRQRLAPGVPAHSWGGCCHDGGAQRHMPFPGPPQTNVYPGGKGTPHPTTQGSTGLGWPPTPHAPPP